MLSSGCWFAIAECSGLPHVRSSPGLYEICVCWGAAHDYSASPTFKRHTQILATFLKKVQQHYCNYIASRLLQLSRGWVFRALAMCVCTFCQADVPEPCHTEPRRLRCLHAQQNHKDYWEQEHNKQEQSLSLHPNDRRTSRIK
jgi:hypothetical protein